MKGSVIITGASSGIGRALAFEFSKRGYSLGLCARRLNLLESLKDELSEYTSVSIARLDLSELNSIRDVFYNLEKNLDNIKIVIANAGVAEKSFPGEDTFDIDKKIININLLGAIATIDVGVEVLKKNNGGQIVGISSVAGFRGLSSNPTYSASKGGLSIYMEGIRNHLSRQKITVTVLNPGFIDTPINVHRKYRPFLISAEKGAQLMANMIEKKVLSSTVPIWPWAFVTKFMQLIPDRLWGKINF